MSRSGSDPFYEHDVQRDYENAYGQSAICLDFLRLYDPHISLAWWQELLHVYLSSAKVYILHSVLLRYADW